jgi:alpha-galactosidase
LQSGQLEYWAKPLANDEWAVMILNRSDEAKPVTYQWSTSRINDDANKRVLDTTKTVFNWTDAWTGKTGDTSKKLESKLAPHGVIVLRLKARS